jgi:hypothetical protein
MVSVEWCLIKYRDNFTFYNSYTIFRGKPTISDFTIARVNKSTQILDMPLTNKKFWEELIAYFPWYDTGHIENHASNNSLLLRVYSFLPSRCLATIVGFLPSGCLATIRGFLPSRCLGTIRGHTQTHTHRQQYQPTLFFQNRESMLKNTHIWASCAFMRYLTL